MFKLNFRIFSALFILHFLTIFVRGYVITTPRKWAAGETNQVCVTLSTPATSEDSVSIGIRELGNKNETEAFIIFLQKLVIPEGMKHICEKVSLGKTRHDSGYLIITGILEGVALNYSKIIFIANDNIKTFVQTDKFLYKPSQTVQFRVLSVNGPFLKVSLNQYEEIWVQDPFGIRIAQWLNVTNSKGLIHKSFILSEETEEGTYKIIVRASGEKTVTRTFRIEEYVLPRFEVTVNPPSYIVRSLEIFDIEVCAKYAFGHPVKGYVTLIVDNRYNIVVNKTENISGCKYFSYNISELTRETRVWNRQSFFVSVFPKKKTKHLEVNALVREEGTGVSIKAKEVLVDIIEVKSLRFKLRDSDIILKSELPYFGEVRAAYTDGSVASNVSVKVCIKIVCKNRTMDANGVVKFAIPPHLNNQHNNFGDHISFGIRPDNSGENYNYFHLNKIIVGQTKLKVYNSPSNSSLKIKFHEDTLECDRSTESIEFQLPVLFAAVKQKSVLITVQVVSRGQIQFSKSFDQVLDKENSMNIDDSLFVEPMKPPLTKGLVRGQFVVPMSLPKTISPHAKIIIWYTRDDGEVVADYGEVDITKCLLNNVNLSWSTGRSKPGDYTILSLKTEPLSFCSLGVVDKSVHLVRELSGEENSLTWDSVLNAASSSELKKGRQNSQVNDLDYCLKKTPNTSNNDDIVFIPSPNEGHPPLMVIKPSIGYIFFETFGIDAIHLFDYAGLNVFSDQTIETRSCKMHGLPIYLNAVPYSSTNRFSTVKKRSTAENIEHNSRTSFPETWLWQLVNTPEDGVIEQELILPDTVTEWVGSAVCVHPIKGIGISNNAFITTFKDLFVDLVELPVSVKRGEIFPIKISIFNNLKESLPITLVLEESPDYEILCDKKLAVGNGERSSCVAAEDKVVHSIRIQPKSIGMLNITVVASVDHNLFDSCGQITGQVPSDVLTKSIQVTNEGEFVKEVSVSKYICTEGPAKNRAYSEIIVLRPPPDIIPDSARAFVSVFGNLMGPTLENFVKFIKMPHRSELQQDMLSFASNIFIMQYWGVSGYRNTTITEKMIHFMEKDYQRVLSYRRKDGSFSAFGEFDYSGSTWLTAFVLKSFAQARNFISIDADDLNKSKDWLESKQLENGCFKSVGRFVHKEIKGGLAEPKSPFLISSFVLISLVEAQASGKVVRKAVQCLTSDNKLTRNSYYLAVKAYALALAGSPDAQKILKELLSLGDASYYLSNHWTLPEGFESSKEIQVQIAGYAILALLAVNSESHERSYFHEVQKIIKLVNNVRNEQGSFVSNQEPIVVLQALAEFEKVQNQEPLNATVIVSTINGVYGHFTVNNQNKFIQQTGPIINGDSTYPFYFGFDVSGHGCVLVQFLLRYNVTNTESSGAFIVNADAVTVAESTCKEKLIEVCVSYLKSKKSNMGVIEIDLVSGYFLKKAGLNKIVAWGTRQVEDYEVDGSLLTVYVKEFTSEKMCVAFKVIREVDVENAKPGTVKVYDLYEPGDFVMEEYTMPPVEECKPKRLSVLWNQLIILSRLNASERVKIWGGR